MVLLQVGQDLGHAGTLDFDKDLALGNRPQGLDDLHFSLNVGNAGQEVDDGLYHSLNGLFELAMLLGEDRDLVAEQVPITGVLA